MSGMSPGAKSDLAKVVEKQMRFWELARAQRVAPPAAESPREVAGFVTVSRTVASGGSEVATLLGERLHWPVFDREILQAMAGDDQVRARLYEHLDERDVGWLDETVRWLLRGEFRKEDYFVRLTETVLALARQGHAVFLGRGVDLILPRERGLRVRITASPPHRARTLAARMGVSEALAMAELERIDRERDDFRRHHFGRAANDAACYDLTVNREVFTAAQAVDLILLGLRARGIMT